MILAAGLGTRLRPLTDRTSKALVDVGGKPMLEWVALRLIEAGVDRLVINVHHHADQIRSFVRERNGFGVEVRFSAEETEPLGTGGGLAAAASCLRRSEPFYIHNSDIITDIDLAALYRAHEADRSAMVTLAVGGRESQRYLVFDDEGLCGWGNDRTGVLKLARNLAGEPRNLPFTGVHVASPGVLDHLSETGVFSIITTYMRLASEGHRIVPYDVGDVLWFEIGNLQRLARARAWADETKPG